eukprot:1736320-Amphidinium_carterae.3
MLSSPCNHNYKRLCILQSTSQTSKPSQNTTAIAPRSPYTRLNELDSPLDNLISGGNERTLTRAEHVHHASRGRPQAEDVYDTAS